MNSTCREPMILAPAYKDYIWGGERLREEYNKNTDMTPVAESWECSAHPNGESYIRSGKYSGQTLSALICMYPEILGCHAGKLMGGKLPILMKLIDAKDRLSIQVHPDDEYAKKTENGQCGKTECWYILDATEDAKLVYGLARDTEKKKLEKALKKCIKDPDNKENARLVEKFFNTVHIKKDEVYFIPAGTVHAIGAGALIAEIQENSDLTYRLYDYNRKDKNGNLRQLHLEKALEVMDTAMSKEARQPMRVRRFFRGFCIEVLARCRYFEMRRLLLEGKAKLKTEDNSFRVLTMVDGSADISFENEEGKVTYEIVRGDTIFVPASSVDFCLAGSAIFIDASC